MTARLISVENKFHQVSEKCTWCLRHRVRRENNIKETRMVASCMAYISALKMEVVSCPPNFGQLLPDCKSVTCWEINVFITSACIITNPMFSCSVQCLSTRRLIRRPEHIGRHCGIARRTEGHSFDDHLISGSVSVTPSSVIEASIVLCSVSSWLMWVSVQSACAPNTRYKQSVRLNRRFALCDFKFSFYMRHSNVRYHEMKPKWQECILL
jgi:hypothetical protein